MFTKKGDKAMTKELIATRKYNGETYSFYMNKPEYQGEKGCCGITEQEIRYTYGKSIWDMTAEELTKYDLWDIWLDLVKINEEG